MTNETTASERERFEVAKRLRDHYTTDPVAAVLLSEAAAQLDSSTQHPLEGLDPDGDKDPEDLIGQYASALLAWNQSPMENDVRERYRNASAALYAAIAPRPNPEDARAALPAPADQHPSADRSKE